MSKTPRQAFLSKYWVGTKGGLLTAKHIRKMGMARWLFDYLTLNQTALTPSGEGQFNYGHPTTLEQIAFDMSEGEDVMPERTIRCWLNILKRECYVRVERHSNHGITIWIAKAKAKTRKVKITAEQAKVMENGASALLASRQQAQNLRHDLDTSSKNSSHDLAASSIASRHDMAPSSGADSPQYDINKLVASFYETPISKGSTPKNLLYHKQESGAKDAPSPRVSLKELAKKLQPPPPKKNRPLQEQIEELKRRGLWKSPGNVVEIRKEATA